MSPSEVSEVKRARKFAAFVRDRLSTPPGAVRQGVTYTEGGTLWQQANELVERLSVILRRHGAE